MRILQVVNDMHRKRCIIARFVATDFSWDNHFRSEDISGTATFVVGAVCSNCDWFRLNSLWITFRSELLWVQKDCTTLMKSGWTWLANAGQAGSLTRTGAWSTKSESVLFITMSNDFAIKHAVFHQLLSVPWFHARSRKLWNWISILYLNYQWIVVQKRLLQLLLKSQCMGFRLKSPMLRQSLQSFKH